MSPDDDVTVRDLIVAQKMRRDLLKECIAIVHEFETDEALRRLWDKHAVVEDSIVQLQRYADIGIAALEADL